MQKCAYLLLLGVVVETGVGGQPVAIKELLWKAEKKIKPLPSHKNVKVTFATAQMHPLFFTKYLKLSSGCQTTFLALLSVKSTDCPLPRWKKHHL